MKNKILKNKGFTLIELLVVITVIGLLSSIILVSVEDARNKARNNRKNQIVNQYVRAASLYLEKYGEYPDPGSVNFDWCLGPYSATDKCYQGFIAYDATLSSMFAEFIPGPPADDTTIIPGTTYGYKGILYQCASKVGGDCKRYRFAWLLKGMNTTCAGNADGTTSVSGNKLCRLFSD